VDSFSALLKVHQLFNVSELITASTPQKPKWVEYYLERNGRSTADIPPRQLTVPNYPVIFSKPADTLAGPTDDIHIHPDAQEKMDYEGELTVVIGRDAKNVSEADALDYVLGYTAGNDVSARTFQLPDNSGGQYGYAKSFDSFAPIGPAIWSPKLIPDPQKLRYVLRVNGKVRQETGTDDMIWSVRQIIAHLSRGTTLRKGTVIMTGTPAGVGFFQKKFLKDGDVVEVEIEGLGKISNKMVFD
jgi:2-keto-4-pentenoate hydratase/2-oxohepta-3-ene-1,7-dioic acid hydratase in catechol pathway